MNALSNPIDVDSSVLSTYSEDGDKQQQQQQQQQEEPFHDFGDDDFWGVGDVKALNNDDNDDLDLSTGKESTISKSLEVDSLHEGAEEHKEQQQHELVNNERSSLANFPARTLNQQNCRQGMLAKQSLLAKMYKNRSVRSAGKSQTNDSAGATVGSKRVFSKEDASADSGGNSTGDSKSQHTSVSSSMSRDTLLHNSCKLYPTTVDIVRSALGFDPEAIRRAIPMLVDSTTPASSSEPLVKKQKLIDSYAYPINIALHHKASLEVVELLAKAGPDVLLLKDGPWEGSSLTLAIRSECDMAIIKAILAANPKQTQVADRQNALPLHAALQVPKVSLELIKLLYRAFPGALLKPNVRGDTPVQVAEKNPYCKEDIVDYLQEEAYSPFEENAIHLDDAELANVQAEI